jgi:hypothetical protein
MQRKKSSTSVSKITISCRFKNVDFIFMIISQWGSGAITALTL